MARPNYGGGVPAQPRPQRLPSEKPPRPVGRITATRPAKQKRVRRPARAPRPAAQQVDPFIRELDALTQLQYGPQERQLESERRVSDIHSRNMASWYGQHVRDMQQAQIAHQAYTAGMQAAAFQQANTAAATDTSQNNALIQQMQASAAQRGATVDPALLAQMQQGVAARQVMGTAGGQLLGAQGQAQSGYLANRVGVAGEQGLQAQQDEMARRRKIEQLAADLAADKGAFRVVERGKLQDRAHKQRLEEAVFGEEVRELNADIADQRADNRRQAKNDRLQRRNTRSQIRDRKEDNELAREKEARIRREGESGGDKALKGNDRNGDGLPDRGPYRGLSESERDKLDHAMRLLRRKGVNRKNSEQALDALIFEENIPARLARRAMRVHFRRQRRVTRPPNAKGPSDELRPT